MIVAAIFLAVGLAAPPDQFFIVSSVDARHARIIVKRPTDVTAVLTIPSTAKLRGERGETLGIGDFRAGDTIYAVVTPSSQGPLVASSIRRGAMTLTELRRRYLPELPQ